MDNNEKLKEIFSEVLDIELQEINDSLSPKNCGKWDSVKNLLLLSEIESTFDVSLEFEDMNAMTDFGKVKEGLKKYGVTDLW